jgi:hypothetical protein
MSEGEPTWFEASSRTLKQYNDQCIYLDQAYRLRYRDPDMKEKFERLMKEARMTYRNTILGWYRKLCLPLKPGEVTPNEVARLLKEEGIET